MTILKRPTAASRMLDLTRELAEDFHTVPLPVVSKTVRSASAGLDLETAEAWETLELIERRARHELGRLRTA